MFRYFSSGDKRNMLSGVFNIKFIIFINIEQNEEPRALFLAIDYPEIPEQLEIFKEGSDFNQMLDNICKEYINKTVCFDDYNGEVKIILYNSQIFNSWFSL